MSPIRPVLPRYSQIQSTARPRFGIIPLPNVVDGHLLLQYFKPIEMKTWILGLAADAKTLTADEEAVVRTWWNLAPNETGKAHEITRIMPMVGLSAGPARKYVTETLRKLYALAQANPQPIPPERPKAPTPTPNTNGKSPDEAANVSVTAPPLLAQSPVPAAATRPAPPPGESRPEEKSLVSLGTPPDGRSPNPGPLRRGTRSNGAPSATRSTPLLRPDAARPTPPPQPAMSPIFDPFDELDERIQAKLSKGSGIDRFKTLFKDDPEPSGTGDTAPPPASPLGARPDRPRLSGPPAHAASHRHPRARIVSGNGKDRIPLRDRVSRPAAILDRARRHFNNPLALEAALRQPQVLAKMEPALLELIRIARTGDAKGQHPDMGTLKHRFNYPTERSVLDTLNNGLIQLYQLIQIDG